MVAEWMAKATRADDAEAWWRDVASVNALFPITIANDHGRMALEGLDSCMRYICKI